MDRTKGRISAAAGFCFLWALILFATAAAAYHIAGNGELLSGEMYRFAPPEVSGLPGSEYPEMGRMTAEYLTGRRQEFQYTYHAADGREITCFQPHEAAHMEDCRGLIRTAGILRWISFGAALVFLAAGIAIRRCRKRFLTGIITGFTAAAAVFAAVLVWGLVNFDGLFITFHKVAFTNDGWLLDPRTDMLIRLMPTPFFVNLGVRVLAAVTAAAVAAFGAAGILRLAMKKKEKQKVHDAEKAACRA